MNRRQFTGTIAAATAAGFAPRRARAADRPPNILFFITDDQSWRDCSAYGSRWVRTPNFDRVGREGVRFEQAFVASPSCSPSRAAALTGCNPWELEAGGILHGAVPARFATYPEVLAGAGYHVGFTGKGWGPGDPRPGGRTDNPAGPMYNQVRIRPRPAPELSDVDYAANLAAFLKARQAHQPFCFWLGTLEPHAPFNAENPTLLPYRYQDLELPAWWPQTAGVKLERALAFAEMEHADATLGKALAVLEAAGELDRTLVIVAGDNGTWQPRGKTNLYDGGLRVPLLMRWPGVIQPGRVVDDLVSLRDLCPTILEAAGVAAPATVTGRSFLNVLRAGGSGQIDPLRTWVTGMLEWHDRAYPMRCLRTDRWLYIRNYTAEPRGVVPPYGEQPPEVFERDCQRLNHYQLLRKYSGHPQFAQAAQLVLGPRPPVELYDCRADPEQLTNLAGRPEVAAVERELGERLTAYQRQTNDPRATGRGAELEAIAQRIETERREAERARAGRP